MRQITQNAANAFFNKQNFKSGNTDVEYKNAYGGVSSLYLHGNEIATYLHGSHVLYIDACGWLTTTTKERLNGLEGVVVVQKKGVWYLNGIEWDGTRIAA